MATQRVQSIEGLRAFAVLMVVCFHVWVGKVSGGVDVFLALSGFFLAVGMVNTAVRGASLNPLSRIWRIARRLWLPMGFVILWGAGAMLSLAAVTRQVSILNDGFASGGFWMNWHLALSEQSYAAASASVSVFQHLWSMSVQMQVFAILTVLGCLVLGCVRVVGSRRNDGQVSSSSARVTMTIALVVVTVASMVWAFGASSVLLPSFDGFLYYDTFARLWEISLGGLVGIVATANTSAWTYRIPPWLGSLGTVCALTLLVSTGFWLDGTTQFPGPWALVPVVSGLVAVVLAMVPGGHANRILGSRVAVYIGSLSYPLYLWHWVLLIVWLTYRSQQVGATLSLQSVDVIAGCAIIVVSLALSMATVRVTNWMDRRSWHRWVRWVTLIVCLVLVLGVMPWRAHQESHITAAGGSEYPGAAALTPGRVLPDRTASGLLTPPLSAAATDLPPRSDECLSDNIGTDFKKCSFGDVNAKRVIMLVGGSHSEHWLPALDLFGSRNGYRIDTLMKGGCPLAIDDALPYTLDGKPYPECTTWRMNALNEVIKTKPDYVFVTSTRPYNAPRTGDYVPLGYEKAYQELVNNGIRVIAMRDNAWLTYPNNDPRNPVECLAAGGHSQSCGVPRSQALPEPNPATLSTVYQELANTGRFFSLDLTNAACDRQYCPAIVGNVLVWRDSHHFTATYNRTMEPQLADALLPIVARP